jgi:hypothetical protein
MSINNLTPGRKPGFLAALSKAIDDGTDALINITTTTARKGGKVVSKTTKYTTKKAAEGIRNNARKSCELRTHKKHGKPRNARDLRRLNEALDKC